MQNSETNSAHSANTPKDTANSSDIITRARGGRKIDPQAIGDIARLCAKQLTESEACRRLGIKPRHWFDWKTRHNRSEKFAELLEAFRADRIDTLVTKIEDGANGKGMKQPDWRAAAHLLKIADAARFGDAVKADSPPQVQIISDTALKAILDKLYGPKPVVTVESVSEPKQIVN